MSAFHRLALSARSAPLLLLGALAAGCGAAPPPVVEPTSDGDQGDARPRQQLAMESEIGALNEADVQKAFERASRKLSGCFGKGVQRLPYLAGEIRFLVRVSPDGAAKWVYVKDSNLGDHETEACMLGVLRSVTWPKPLGGEGLAENNFTFEPSGDERPPVDWTEAELGKPYEKALPALSSCRKEAGTGPLKATLYVDPEGKALAVGVSTSDERGDGATKCIVDVLRGVTFPSPGSYASKVTVVIE